MSKSAEGQTQTNTATVICEGTKKRKRIFLYTKTLDWIVDIIMHVYKLQAMDCLKRSVLMALGTNSFTTGKTKGLFSSGSSLNLIPKKPQLSLSVGGKSLILV